MCCCINISFNLITNIISRLADDIMDAFYCKCKKINEDQYDCNSDSEFYGNTEETGWF
jgi:hypothetical protein